MDKPLAPLRGGYCIRNRFANSALRSLDTSLSLLAPARRNTARRRNIEPPGRILISNVAHLGDIVVATSVLPVLKSAFPKAKIGFLIGSWSRPVLHGHPWVDQIHTLDHWAANRSAIPRYRKIRQYIQTRQQAIREINEIGYDVAIDLYWNVFNSLMFLHQTNIPVRIGYGSGGFGPLATHCVEFQDTRLHVSERYLALLQELPVSASDLAQCAPVLPPGSQQAVREYAKILQDSGVRNHDYLVFHPGAGDALKEWPVQRWRDLAERSSEQGLPILFTGSGPGDRLLIEKATRGLAHCINMCDRLSWPVFVEVIRHTRLLLCVDTVAGHVAGATGTPCGVITLGRWPYLWHPMGATCRVLSSPVPCAPCHRTHGCEARECLMNLDVPQVYQAGLELLSTDGRACGPDQHSVLERTAGDPAVTIRS